MDETKTFQLRDNNFTKIANGNYFSTTNSRPAAKTDSQQLGSNDIDKVQSKDLVDKDYVTKKCSVRLQPLGLDVKQILSMEESEKSHLKDGNKEQQKRDNDSFNDGPQLKKHKNDDVIVLEADSKSVEKTSSKSSGSDVTLIKVKSGSGSKDGGKEKKTGSADGSPTSDGKLKGSSLQRTGSFDSSRKTEKDSSKSNFDKTDRTSLNCLVSKLAALQQHSQKSQKSSRPSGNLPSKKSMSPSGIKPSKDSHHRRKEEAFITKREKSNSSPKKISLKKTNSLPVVKDNKIGNLFCPTTDAKVTILAINKPPPKDSEQKPPTTSNSVTITKISSGDSLNVNSSKDIKKVFSPKSKTSPDSMKSKFSLKNFGKSDKHRSGDKHKDHRNREKEHRSRESSRESRDGREHKEKHNYCGKCNEQFSTKEAKKLHTCNSILDAHYLIDERDRQKTSPNSESSSTSLSRSSSRSSSPGLPGVSGVSASGVSGTTTKKSSQETPPKLKLAIKSDSPESGKVKFTMKKDDSEEKVKKSGFGMKRDSPKEKWVESKSNFKSDHYNESHGDRTSGISIEPVKLASDSVKHHVGKTNGDECRNKEDLQNIYQNRTDNDFTFTGIGKRTYSPSMGDGALSGDGKESPRETNSKDSPASQADSGVFSIASSASPSKLDGGLNSDVRSPDSPSRIGSCLDNTNASQWSKTSMAGPGMMSGMSTSSPAGMSSYPDSCIPQGLQIPNNLSITRVVNQMSGPYPTSSMTSGAMNSNNKTMNIIANAPWMNPSLGPNHPQMHPQFSSQMMTDSGQKKRGRPRKNEIGFPGKMRGPKSKDDDKDMYDFEDDDSKTVQPLRPRRQNPTQPNYKDPDSDEDGKQRMQPQASMIHATQGFRQVQEKAMGMTQVDGFGHNPTLQEAPADGQHLGPHQQKVGEGEKDEKNVSYTCSEIKETQSGGIRLKIKIKKSASPAPPDPEPPNKKPKTNSYDGIEENEKEEPSIMSTMNEMQRLARPSPTSDYQMSPSPLKSPMNNPTLNSQNSPNSTHNIRAAAMMKPGIPGGGDPRNQTPPENMNHQMMRPNGPGNFPGQVPVSSSPRNMEEAARGPFPKVNNPYAMQNSFPSQPLHNRNPNNFDQIQHPHPQGQQPSQQQHQKIQQQPQQQQHLSQQQQQLPNQQSQSQPQQQQQPQQQPPPPPQQQQQPPQQKPHPQNYPPHSNFNNFNMGYNNQFMNPRQQQQQQQQQMYSRQQQYEHHMASYRPGAPQQRPMGPNGAPDGSTIGQVTPNMSQSGPNVAQGRPNGSTGPNLGQGIPNMGTVGPNAGHRGSAMGPGGSSIGPGGPNMVPGGQNVGQRGPTAGPVGPNMGPGGPNMAPGGPNMGAGGSNMGAGGSNMVPGGPNMGPGGPNIGPGGPNMGPGGSNMGPGGPNVGLGGQSMGPGGSNRVSVGSNMGPTISSGPNMGPGVHVGPGMGPNMGSVPGQMPMRPGFMQQQMINQRYPLHQQMGAIDPMSRMGNMPSHIDPSRMHPNMSLNQMGHGNMMRPMGPGSMGSGHMPGYPGNSNITSMAPTSLSHESSNNSVMNTMAGGGVIPPNISPGSIHPSHPSRSPQMAGDRQLFQTNQYRMSSPQYQGQHSSYSNSPTYPGTPNPQGYPPTPGGYPQPHTPGYQKPPTPQSIGNPPTPQGAIQNPLTPGGSYPNPSTPGSYPNPSTPVSCQNPLTPQPPQSPVTPSHNLNTAGTQPQIMPQNTFNPPKSESVIQPTPNIFKDSSKMSTPMLSPPSSVLTSDLRKIRRPSKSVTPGTVSPNQKNLSPNQIKTEIKTELDPDIKKEVPSIQSPFNPVAEIKQEVKAEPVVPKVERPESPKPPPPPPKTPEPPKEPRWGEDGPDGMPEKALKLVFQYVCHTQGCLPFLLQAMRICKLWNKVAKEPSLWTHANLGNKIKEKARTEKNLEWILKNKFPNAMEVDVCNWRAAISSPALKIIAANCPNLRGLGLSQCVKLNYEDVRIIPSLFPNLQKIDISCVAPTTASSRSAASSTCLSDLITAIGEKMTHFNMSNNKMAGLPFVFKAISQHSKNLQFLDVSNISTTSRDTILINIEKIQKGCPKMRVLRTTNTMLGLNEVPVREQMSSPGFPFLEELTIGVDQRGYFDGMDDQQIERILKKSDKLKVLDIKGCKGISDSTLVRLPCWDIEWLNVSGCSVTSSSKDGLELLVKKWCRTLVDLDIGNTTDNRTVDWAVMAFVENEDVLRLRKLNLNNTGVSLKCLTKLLNVCHSLESLNLTSCRALPRGMKRMYHNREDVQGLTTDINDGKFDPKDAGSDDDD